MAAVLCFKSSSLLHKETNLDKRLHWTPPTPSIIGKGRAPLQHLVIACKYQNPLLEDLPYAFCLLFSQNTKDKTLKPTNNQKFTTQERDDEAVFALQLFFAQMIIRNPLYRMSMAPWCVCGGIGFVGAVGWINPSQARLPSLTMQTGVARLKN